jgi:hypothetical protein
VIHQEFGNLGIQNRKGLIMPTADMAWVSSMENWWLIFQKYWKNLCALMAIAKQ